VIGCDPWSIGGRPMRRRDFITLLVAAAAGSPARGAGAEDRRGRSAGRPRTSGKQVLTRSRSERAACNRLRALDSISCRIF